MQELIFKKVACYPINYMDNITYIRKPIKNIFFPINFFFILSSFPIQNKNVGAFVLLLYNWKKVLIIKSRNNFEETIS